MGSTIPTSAAGLHAGSKANAVVPARPCLEQVGELEAEERPSDFGAGSSGQRRVALISAGFDDR